ncbi:hypothetical protein [Nocardia macrotermitis]|uniref:Uncharacterized protein n=1 Tax=Nocardia macrotermitis TaxID=2585198 RepID=A0A7K0DA53_9NOCA|nr:hypothetical protein [Nocardia macrotermitis]MQY22489.1 hypothetical protein [Nocardia macrotermitis]
MPESAWYPGDFASSTPGAVQDTALYPGPVEYGTPDHETPPDPAAPPPADPAQADGFTAATLGQAMLRNGEIIVTATESGMLQNVHVDAGQLRRPPAELADDLLRLCRLAAGRAGAARRTHLAQLGLTDHVLDLLGLPEPDAVEQNEIDDEDDNDYEPRSWLDHDGSVW